MPPNCGPVSSVSFALAHVIVGLFVLSTFNGWILQQKKKRKRNNIEAMQVENIYTMIQLYAITCVL